MNHDIRKTINNAITSAIGSSVTALFVGFGVIIWNGHHSQKTQLDDLTESLNTSTKELSDKITDESTQRINHENESDQKYEAILTNLSNEVAKINKLNADEYLAFNTKLEKLRLENTKFKIDLEFIREDLENGDHNVNDLLNIPAGIPQEEPPRSAILVPEDSYIQRTQQIEEFLDKKQEIRQTLERR